MAGIDRYISPEYRELNEQLHRHRNDYGVKGDKHLRRVRRVRNQYRADTVLDYGCGSAALARHAEFPVACYDPCIPDYSELPYPSDMIVCTDVLEHVEPEKLDAVLRHIRNLMRVCGYFVIATRPDRSKSLPDGSNPHRVIKPGHWWKHQMGFYFEIASFKVKKGEVECITE